MKLSGAAIGIFLSACASAPTIYVEPTEKSDRFSQIELVNDSSYLLMASLFEDAMTCTGTIGLEKGFKGLGLGERRTIFVEKGKPIAIGARYVTDWTKNGGVDWTMTRCDLNATFVPRADVYRILYATDDRLKVCGIKGSERTSGQWKDIEPKQFNLRGFNLAFSQAGPWCKPLTETQRASLIQQ